MVGYMAHYVVDYSTDRDQDTRPTKPLNDNGTHTFHFWHTDAREKVHEKPCIQKIRGLNQQISSKGTKDTLAKSQCLW